MKRFVKLAFSMLCSGTVALSFAGCNASDTGKCTVLGEPAAAQSFDYDDRKDAGYISIKQKADNFAYRFSAAAYSGYDSGKNFSVAPVSVFSALSLAAECSGGQTRSELLSALGVEYADLAENYSKLYRSLDAEHISSGGSLEGALKLANSVWINQGLQYNRSCVQNLSQKYFTYSYSADFTNDNANANRAVRSFVKDKTRGLIDRDFELSPQTVFTLINALYLKDIWNMNGNDLGLTDTSYTFTEYNGNTKELKLLRGYYQAGRVQEFGDYSTFFTKTLNGYKIKFILPKNGRTVGDVFTSENLAEVNGISDYGEVDDAEKIIYHTRCLFPEFATSYDKDIVGILKNNFNINALFDSELCDFSAFTESKSYCDKVMHVNTLKVNRKGIEGAAVTVLPSATSPGPGEYAKVYTDFVVDRSFGFILTDPMDTVLFSGVVNDI
ncbi:MAG: hypothetical protein K2J54_04450 [Clostridia bacterium]|nr:hypothetical protein [Clostridia bacterium]